METGLGSEGKAKVTVINRIEQVRTNSCSLFLKLANKKGFVSLTEPKRVFVGHIGYHLKHVLVVSFLVSVNDHVVERDRTLFSC